MLTDDNFTRRRHEFGAELAAPRAVFEGFVLPRRLLNRSDVRPCLVVAWTVAMMHSVEYSQLRLPRGTQDPQHVGNAVVRLGHGFDTRPDLAAVGDEVVVGIDDQKCGDLLVVRHTVHASLPRSRAQPLLRQHDEWLALLDHIGAEFRGVAAADVLRRVDRSGRDE